MIECNPYISMDHGGIEWAVRFRGSKKLYGNALQNFGNGQVDLRELHGNWKEYSFFEREKLRELNKIKEDERIIISTSGYCLSIWLKKVGKDEFRGHTYSSSDLIGYELNDYLKDSWSGRILNHAKFLKAVCEKEGVEWLPEKKADTLRSLLEPKKRICNKCKKPFNNALSVYNDDDCNCSTNNDYCPSCNMNHPQGTKCAMLENDEKEWRKSLLNFIWGHCIKSDDAEDFEDLRNRFT